MAQQAYLELLPYVRMLSTPDQARAFSSAFTLNRAYRSYSEGEYAEVPGSVLRAMLNDPRKAADRGVLSILAKSVVRMGKK
jgi:hypothetical protein